MSTLLFQRTQEMGPQQLLPWVAQPVSTKKEEEIHLFESGANGKKLLIGSSASSKVLVS